MKTNELLKGTLQTIILNLLARHGRLYGYEMVQKVREESQGTFGLTEGTLCPALHKLEAGGLLSIEKVTVGNRLRKYYSLTPSDSTKSAAKANEFEVFVTAMKLLLNPKTAVQ